MVQGDYFLKVPVILHNHAGLNKLTVVTTVVTAQATAAHEINNSVT